MSCVHAFVFLCLVSQVGTFILTKAVHPRCSFLGFFVTSLKCSSPLWACEYYKIYFCGSGAAGGGRSFCRVLNPGNYRMFINSNFLYNIKIQRKPGSIYECHVPECVC